LVSFRQIALQFGDLSAPADAVEMVQGVLLGGGGSRDVEHVT